jgi:hypothetical protein
MARLRYNGLRAELAGSGLTNSATAITFAAALTHSGGTNVPTITGSDYIPLAILDSDGRLVEVVYLTAYTAAATTGTISRGQESTTGVSHGSGVGIAHGPTARDVVTRSAHSKRTSGNLAKNSTTFVDVDNGMDMTIAAAAGDVLEAGLLARWAGSTYAVFDFVTVVAGSPVNSITAETTAGTGLANSLWGSSTASTVGGRKRYVVQTGDLSSGTVTLRLRVFCGGAITIQAVDPMLYTDVFNHGPA